jgi:hypothetical protein
VRKVLRFGDNGLTFEDFASNGDFQEVENLGADGSWSAGHHLQVTSKHGLDLWIEEKKIPASKFVRQKTTPQTFRKTNLSHRAWVLFPVARILSSLVRTAFWKMTPFKPGALPATMAAW